ncbi:MAG: alpha-L-fucosidase [Balneolaceae bacterium]|nr:alpha-L-fucosidase [Balneolaceae bacterium]
MGYLVTNMGLKSDKMANISLLARLLLAGALCFCFLSGLSAQHETTAGNNPERLEWFNSLGYGLFIHWSVDSQIGTVISHSLVGASDQYQSKFFTELPDTFNPEEFDAREWARMAKVAGVNYVVFTTKHHSGFCMFDTETTDFNFMNTPYGRDVTREVVEAFRDQGIAIGFYFSPDDFHFLHEQGTMISRRRPEALPSNNPELMEHNKQQIRELFTNYGTIDILFIDGEPDGLRELAWSINPDLVITRGAMETPEIAPSTTQGLPGNLLSDVWEACYTMGTSWQYKPTNEQYRSGTDLIENLIESRAKNGNMLLNIGPKPNGSIPGEQEATLREIGTWLFINGESIYGVEPWVISNEDNIWFTRSKQEDAVYAIITEPNWEWGTRKTVILESVRASGSTTVSVLGQNDKVLEYVPETIPETKWENTNRGLMITAWRAQRIYNDRTWPNPVVLKITNPVPDRSVNK